MEKAALEPVVQQLLSFQDIRYKNQDRKGFLIFRAAESTCFFSAIDLASGTNFLTKSHIPGLFAG